MKANELMLNDLVNTPKGIRQIKETSTKCALLNWEDYSCTLDEINPIPLTEDILKENGFNVTKTYPISFRYFNELADDFKIKAKEE